MLLNHDYQSLLMPVTITKLLKLINLQTNDCREDWNILRMNKNTYKADTQICFAGDVNIWDLNGNLPAGDICDILLVWYSHLLQLLSVCTVYSSVTTTLCTVYIFSVLIFRHAWNKQNIKCLVWAWLNPTLLLLHLPERAEWLFSVELTPATFPVRAQAFPQAEGTTLQDASKWSPNKTKAVILLAYVLRGPVSAAIASYLADTSWYCCNIVF